MKQAKIRLGRKIDLIINIIFLMATLVLWQLIFMVIRDADSSENLMYVILSGILSFLPIGSIFTQKVSCYAELKNNQLYIKMPFRVLKIYSKKNLKIEYAVRFYKAARGREGLYPCLIVGVEFTNEICYKVNLLKNKDVLFYEHYFLMILNKKRLSSLANWWQKEIELPNEKEWSEFCREWKKVHMHGVKDVEKFYGMIEDYNNSIKASNCLQD